MQQFDNQTKQRLLNSNSIGRCTVSFILVLLTQLSLSLVPRFLSASSLLIQLALSGLVLVLVLGLGRWCRRIAGVYASAPAFVFFNLVFVWVVYISIVRQAISHLINIVFSIEVILVFLGLCSILSIDPGLVTYGSSHSDKLVETETLGVEAHNEGSALFKRVRYCRNCKAYVKGFDHHCPAFGNCIGQNNYVLFMVLLVGFLTTEATYIMCASQFARGSQILDGTLFETHLSGCLVISTTLFSLLQVIWQGVFFAWHVYCVFFNIRTDEWMNWKKYPEFQLIVQSEEGGGSTKIMFRNPYDKGILHNVKEFLSLEG